VREFWGKWREVDGANGGQEGESSGAIILFYSVTGELGGGLIFGLGYFMFAVREAMGWAERDFTS
jgi:hypothetical protein